MSHNYLYNIKKNIIQNIKDDDVISSLYYLETRLPTIDDINNINAITNKTIKKFFSEENAIDKVKKAISRIDNVIPLFDIYTENIYIISRFNVFERVTYQSYRFPDKKVQKYIIDKKQEKDERLKNNPNLAHDPIFMRKLRKLSLMISFLDNFDLNVLYDTYVQAFYKYSSGKEIIFCKRPSFNKYFPHITPYYERSEIINLALNNDINIPKDQYIDNEALDKLCHIVSKNDINAKILTDHQQHIIKNDKLGLVQYYTIQGSYFMNQYLRNLTKYNTKNSVLEEIITPMWNLIKSAPPFDKSYTLYRFIDDDYFLKDIKIGNVFKEKGFMSTTRDPFYRSDIYKFGFILMKIKIPANIHGVALCLELLSHFPEEEEIIFPPKSKFKLVSKDDNVKFYHTDKDFSSDIKTKYEFEWIENEDISYDKRPNESEIPTVDFLKLQPLESETLEAKIKYFVDNFTSETSQFKTIIGGKEFINIVERYNSTGAYKQFYAMTTKEGFSIYSLYNGYLLYFIEIAIDNGNPEIHINFHTKYNTLNKEGIIKDNDLIKYVSSIGYYFGIQYAGIYPNYHTCNNQKTPMVVIKKQREFSIFNPIDKPKEDITYDPEEDYSIGGNYPMDIYDYLKTGKKKYADSNIPNIEIRSFFSYYNLDTLKSLKPDSILKREDLDELYQIYEKTFKPKYKNASIADFYIWIADNKCNLMGHLTHKMERIFDEDENPFLYDGYIIDNFTFLYNRKLIQTYGYELEFNIKSHKEPQFNEYRIQREIR